mgnify:CR=1 FL=1
MTIELIYFTGCPNVEKARANLREACEKAGVTPDWEEFDQEDETAPEHIRHFGSPSILVDGRDVAGGPDTCCQEKTCRLYENGDYAPDVATIKTAFQQQRNS